jgi:hypothetical protein
MFELFVNPWTMAAGTVLISSPIIIHLINRMRFRRVRWAAMEFLLKSQKRNRRRVIIEQIILLLLRIILVLLAGFLLARFLGALAGPQQNTVHLILLDDTPSMADFHREDGQEKDAFRQAKRVIVEEIAQSAAYATTAQSLIVLRLSALETPRRIDRVNAATVDELRSFLAEIEPSTIHVELAKGLDAAQAILEQHARDRRMLHIVSDFRTGDWSGSPADGIRQAIERLTQAKVDVHLLDCAHPVRAESQRTAVYHDNLSIVEFQPETRTAARFVPVEFTVGVANFSNSERKNVRVTVKVKGAERAEGSFTMPSVMPGTVTVGTFMISFDQLGANPVSVNLENEEAGLLIDNTRFAVVDVRERLPLLIVEGDSKFKGTPEGEAYFLQSLFAESTRGYDVQLRNAADLEKLDLSQYPSIYLLNVPRLSDKATQNIEKYVAAGGGLVFAMGNEIKPDYYNKLYADGKGVFPVPLADKPSERLDEKTRFLRMFDKQQKIYARNESHPIFTRIYRDERTRNRSRENNKYLVYISIDQYFPVLRSKWTAQPGVVDELLTLPNSRSIDDYKDETQNILNALPIEDPRFERFKGVLTQHRNQIRAVLLEGGALYRLVSPLDQLLNDSGVTNDANRPNLQEFWQRPEQLDLRVRLARLIDAVRYGDPLMVAKNFGKGRVVAFLTSAGTAWNNLPNFTGEAYYVMLMVEMQKFLASSGADLNLKLGQTFEFDVDAGRYDSKMRRFFPPKPSLVARRGPATEENVDAGEQPGEVNGPRLRFSFSDARVPGVYEFLLTRKDDPAPDAKPVPAKAADGDRKAQDVFAYAFNVDAAAEGNLQRVTRDELSAAAPNCPLHTPGSGWADTVVKQKKSDLSESVWLYLVFLLVLVIEQAMAVRLSHHGRDTAPVAA